MSNVGLAGTPLSKVVYDGKEYPFSQWTVGAMGVLERHVQTKAITILNTLQLTPAQRTSLQAEVVHQIACGRYGFWALIDSGVLSETDNASIFIAELIKPNVPNFTAEEAKVLMEKVMDEVVGAMYAANPQQGAERRPSPSPESKPTDDSSKKSGS